MHMNYSQIMSPRPPLPRKVGGHDPPAPMGALPLNVDHYNVTKHESIKMTTNAENFGKWRPYLEPPTCPPMEPPLQHVSNLKHLLPIGYIDLWCWPFEFNCKVLNSHGILRGGPFVRFRDCMAFVPQLWHGWAVWAWWLSFTHFYVALRYEATLCVTAFVWLITSKQNIVQCSNLKLSGEVTIASNF